MVSSLLIQPGASEPFGKELVKSLASTLDAQTQSREVIDFGLHFVVLQVRLSTIDES